MVTSTEAIPLKSSHFISTLVHYVVTFTGKEHSNTDTSFIHCVTKVILNDPKRQVHFLKLVFQIPNTYTLSEQLHCWLPIPGIQICKFAGIKQWSGAHKDARNSSMHTVVKMFFLQSFGRLTEFFLELPTISEQKRHYFLHHLPKQIKQNKEKTIEPPKTVITITQEREGKVQGKGAAQVVSPLVTNLSVFQPRRRLRPLWSFVPVTQQWSNHSLTHFLV